MVRMAVLAILAPILGVVVLLSVGAGEGSGIRSTYFAWFAVGAATEIASGLLLLRPTRESWRRGWGILWIACIAYMGGYSNLFLQRSEIDGVRSAAVEVLNLERRAAERPGDIDLRAGLRAVRERFARERPGLSPSPDLVDDLGADAEVLGVLEYVLGLLFVAAFFVLSFATSPEAQRFYGFEDRPEEGGVLGGGAPA